MSLPEFAISGIPLIVIIIALVEEVKAWGVQGKVLRVVSMAIGVAFAVVYQVAVKVPADLMGWLVVVGIGLLYGIAASGSYDFIDKRFPVKV